MKRVLLLALALLAAESVLAAEAPSPQEESQAENQVPGEEARSETERQPIELSRTPLRNIKLFVPSEEVSVDRPVDFPSDI